MRYIDILAKFLDMFPNYINNVLTWIPCGDSCIKITLKNQTKLKFVYFSDTEWTLETDGFYVEDYDRSRV